MCAYIHRLKKENSVCASGSIKNTSQPLPALSIVTCMDRPLGKAHCCSDSSASVSGKYCMDSPLGKAHCCRSWWCCHAKCTSEAKPSTHRCRVTVRAGPALREVHADRERQETDRAAQAGGTGRLHRRITPCALSPPCHGGRVHESDVPGIVRAFSHLHEPSYWLIILLHVLINKLQTLYYCNGSGAGRKDGRLHRQGSPCLVLNHIAQPLVLFIWPLRTSVNY